MEGLRPNVRIQFALVGGAMRQSRHDCMYLCFGIEDGLWLEYRETLRIDAMIP